MYIVRWNKFSEFYVVVWLGSWLAVGLYSIYAVFSPRPQGRVFYSGNRNRTVRDWLFETQVLQNYNIRNLCLNNYYLQTHVTEYSSIVYCLVQCTVQYEERQTALHVIIKFQLLKLKISSRPPSFHFSYFSEVLIFHFCLL